MRAFLDGRSSHSVLYALRPESSYMSNAPRIGWLDVLYRCDRNTRALAGLFRDKTHVIMRRTKGRARVPQQSPQPNVFKVAVSWLVS